jgi:ABC-type long-subunit fatty acid transport system fused permease/ATPase subunit
MLKNPIVQAVLTVIVVVGLLKMFSAPISKIPLIGKYIAL